jgi:flagellar basal body-associated protein FliL
MRIKKGFNPFYVLLVIVGTAFCLTACAYGLMAMRSLRPERNFATANSAGKPPAAAPAESHQLMKFMERHGNRLLLIEIGLLAAASFAAMATDGYWIRRANEKQAAERAEARTAATNTEESPS